MRTEEFKHIILPMRSNLKAYALRLTESDDNAEDLVQEVMLRLWDMRQNIKAENNLKALAITITFLIFIILYFMLFLILIEKIPVGRYG